MNTSSSKSNAQRGTWFNTLGKKGSRLWGGLLEASVSCFRVAWLPRARHAPSRSCRADDNSPTCTNLSANRSQLQIFLSPPSNSPPGLCRWLAHHRCGNNPQSPWVKVSPTSHWICHLPLVGAAVTHSARKLSTHM